MAPRPLDVPGLAGGEEAPERLGAQGERRADGRAGGQQLAVHGEGDEPGHDDRQEESRPRDCRAARPRSADRATTSTDHHGDDEDDGAPAPIRCRRAQGGCFQKPAPSTKSRWRAAILSHPAANGLEYVPRRSRPVGAEHPIERARGRPRGPSRTSARGPGSPRRSSVALTVSTSARCVGRQPGAPPCRCRAVRRAARARATGRRPRAARTRWSPARRDRCRRRGGWAAERRRRRARWRGVDSSPNAASAAPPRTPRCGPGAGPRGTCRAPVSAPSSVREHAEQRRGGRVGARAAVAASTATTSRVPTIRPPIVTPWPGSSGSNTTR